MKFWVAGIFLAGFLISAVATGQNKSAKRSPSKHGASTSSTSQGKTLKICQGVPIPDGYVIVGLVNSPACAQGAYLLQKDDSGSSNDQNAKAAAPTSVAARPRKVSVTPTDSLILKSSEEDIVPSATQPALANAPSNSKENAAPKELSSDSDEVGPGDVVKIETNLVSVPVSVLDRQGRFVPNLQREDFKVLENGVEQRIAYFEPTEKPFTVALLLDTSGSTVFHLSEIKEAAISFAKQLRPQDRVLVVTFNEQVLLLTEATNNLNVVTEVINTYANTGYSTRLYDAIDLVIEERLNKIQGRKAIVLFTDGVDTSSFQATYQSTLRQAEELDALIYPIQYDTKDFVAATQGLGKITIARRTRSWPFPGRTSSQVIYGPAIQTPGTSVADYERADQFLHQLADKTGAKLFQANDSGQLAQSFSKIAEELRCQYSLGYYPQSTPTDGERRQIKVHVDQPDLAVRARDSYVQRSSSNTTQ
jgi:Ca-activated chloride channel family protein